MAGKNKRDYRVIVHTDDPSIFDRLPEADSGYEALMEEVGTDNFWKKDGAPSRLGSAADPTNAGGRILDGDEPHGLCIACGEDVLLDKRGNIGKHEVRLLGSLVTCVGSGKQPKDG